MYKLPKRILYWVIESFSDNPSFAAAVFMGINANLVQAEGASIESSSGNDVEGAKITGLRKIEDGSVVSNIHTSKWRVFTDNGRDFFLQASMWHKIAFLVSLVFFSVCWLHQYFSLCPFVGETRGSWEVLSFCTARSQRRFWTEWSSCCICMQQSGGSAVKNLRCFVILMLG